MSQIHPPVSAPLRFGWPAALLFAAVAGSTVTACMMPFVALAVVAGATLPARRAALTVTTGWLVNQAIGFGLFHYPRTAYSVGWGLAALAASLGALVAARTLLKPNVDLVAVRLVAAFALAFTAYEGLLFLYAGVAGGRDTFTAGIVLRLAASDGIWLAALVAFRLLLARVAPAWFGPRLALRTA